MTRFQSLIAKIAILSLVLSLVAVVSPVSAADATSISDTLSSLTFGATGVTHNLVATIPAGTWASTETVIFTYAEFTAFTGTPQTCTIGTGTATCATSNPNILTVTCTAVACSGALAVTGSNWTSTNPGSGDSHLVTISGTGGITGSFALASTQSDQVTINGSVDPSLTFDIDTATTDIESASPYVVNLGTLTTGAVTSSNGSTINSIFLDFGTNATGGVTVTVVNSDSNVDLASSSAPSDEISAVGGGPLEVIAGTEGYGICVVSASSTGATVTPATKYNGNGNNNCDYGTDHYVGNALTTADTIVSATGPLSAGDVEIAVKAAISSLTEAHNDYTDSITFVATGTF